jgi:hypothetical protein
LLVVSDDFFLVTSSCPPQAQ